MSRIKKIGGWGAIGGASFLRRGVEKFSIFRKKGEKKFLLLFFQFELKAHRGIIEKEEFLRVVARRV